jgi:biotin transport system ATP-binding protein/energy-coupling factor transport system ATP-binding protein
MLKVENLIFKYYDNDVFALDSINLNIEEGEYIAIIGPTGCGKTSLVKHFNALLSPNSGDVWVDGLNTKDNHAVGEIRRRVGMVFQNPDNQIVSMTVEEDVSFGPGNLGLKTPEIRQRVDGALAMVGLSEYAWRAPGTLSGGQKQLLAIAGILAMNPKYVILDEPTSSLDPSARQKIFNVLKELNQQGITIIDITHNMDEIIYASRVIVMNKGSVALDGETQDVLSRVEWLKSLGLNTPQVTELMWRLKQMGENVHTNILTIDQACIEIAALINGRK